MRTHRYDGNGDGTLCRREFEAALAEQNIVLSQEEKVKFFKKIDASGDDQVDYKVLLGPMECWYEPTFRAVLYVFISHLLDRSYTV